MTFRLILFLVLFSFAVFSTPQVEAQSQETISVNIRHIHLSKEFFNRIGLDIPVCKRDNSTLTVRCVVLSNIEAYFLLSAPKSQRKKIEKAPILNLIPGQWTLYRTPDMKPFLKSQQKPEHASREIAIRTRKLDSEGKYVIESCEIKNNHFVNSTSSFAVLEKDEVAFIPVSGFGLLMFAF